LSVSSCTGFDDLKIDPCSIVPGQQCYAVPVNQPDKLPYYRDLNLGDICVTSAEYAELVKNYKDLIRTCGKKCGATHPAVPEAIIVPGETHD